MRIHTTLHGESIKDIAKEYGVNEETLKQANELDEFEPTVGEELLVQVPTRTYKAVYGDTINRIALRFGVRKSDIYTFNPWLIGKEIAPGQNITLKIGERKKGMSVANGYFFKGCSSEKLKKVMPFLTYVSFASAKIDKKGIRKIFDCKKEVELCKENSKIPLIRVHDDCTERYKTEKNLSGFAEELINLAVSNDFKGIVLDACPLCNSAEEFSAFLIVLRKLMIGCDLILITEINENSPIEFSEYADGSVLYYPKYATKNPPSFDNGERKILSDFACRGESAKAFVDIPSLAESKDGFINILDAMNIARRNGCEITQNENTLLSHFNSKKQGEYRYTSLCGIRSILELVSEFDYMGICFDIMRTPLSYLMMYSSMFKTSYYTNVRSPEGCSRVSEE